MKNLPAIPTFVVNPAQITVPPSEAPTRLGSVLAACVSSPSCEFSAFTPPERTFFSRLVRAGFGN